MRVIIRDATRAFGRSRIPGADYVLNPYMGCLHGCRYCYVQALCKRYGWSYGRWGEWVVVRRNLPKLVKGKVLSGWIYVSSLCDAYQPIESRFKLTRSALDLMNRSNRVCILTKSDLILRDLDVLHKFRDVEIGLTVNSFDERLRKVLEPRAVSMERRFNALKTIREEGFKCFGFISPVIPYISDVEAVLKDLKGIADYIIVEILNLCVKDFVEWLKDNYPESYDVLTDKNKFWSFTRSLKCLVDRLGVKAEIYYHPQQL